MKMTKRQRRAARTLALPLVAILMMTTMMALDAMNRQTPSKATYKPGAAARSSPNAQR